MKVLKCSVMNLCRPSSFRLGGGVGGREIEREGKCMIASQVASLQTFIFLRCAGNRMKDLISAII